MQQNIFTRQQYRSQATGQVNITNTSKVAGFVVSELSDVLIGTKFF